MKEILKVTLAVLLLLLPDIARAKGPHMEIRATIESFSAVGESLEIVFSGTMSHVSGDGPGKDHWGLSARVGKSKLIIPNRKMAYFFSRGKGPMATHNLKDEYELGAKIYGVTGRQVWITAYGPTVYFDETLFKVTAESVCLAIMEDTMSDTEKTSKGAAQEDPALLDGDKPPQQ